MKKILLAALLALAPAAAQAQSSPGMKFGDVPTAAQWNAFFAAKQDFLGSAPLLPSNLLGAAPITVTLSGSLATVGIVNGTSVANPGTGTLEQLIPIQTTTAASKAFGAADLYKETRRSNAGSAMSDTFPASTTTGLVNGTRVIVANFDATATDTITAGAGTTINGGATDPVGPGRAIAYVYDAPATQWRRTLNTGSALLSANNLSELASAAAARGNLGLGTIAVLNVGTGLVSSAGNLNIANTITAGGPTGSATVAPILTWNAQGQLTAVTSATITPAFSSLTGTPTTLAGYGIASPLPGAQGGTNSAFFQVSGPATSIKTYTFPNSSQAVAMLDLADQTVSGGANVTPLSQSTGNITVDCGARPIQTITNGGAFTITAPASAGYCVLDVTNNASAGAITFSGFSVGASTGDVLTTTNTNEFFIFIYKSATKATYSVKALQ